MKKLYVLMIAAALLGAYVLASASNASTPTLDQFKQPFSETEFRQAQADDRLILIDVYATWCPTCKRQQDVLEAYFTEYSESEVVVFEVDYDTQKEWVSYFNAPRQSTLVLLRGEEQLWFSVAQTRQRTIFSELAQHDAGAKR
ncbi:MAG: thioredoxin domain-containing protein [Gammaproteobacteria bacterium]|nr:thioredoxin domain-containing protein [Gammaproteobacteria bacterium]